ncbi:hypothetical protein chiPu_0029197, partial [Chiloscyllium punctatum]|nr:hypothetical protein [Chiloscyllium punctatum]
HADIEQFRHLDAFDQGAGARQRSQCTLEGLCDGIVEIVERDRSRHREPHALDRARRDRRHRLVGQHGIERGAAGHRIGQRAIAVQGERQRHAAGKRNPALRRLVADDAVEGGRDPAGAAGIGAERTERHAVGDRDRSPRGRAAGHMADAPVPGALRRAEMRIDADARIGELGHVGASDHDEAGALEPRHGGRIGLRRRGILQRPGACARHLPLDVEQVLDRDGNAGKRRRRGVGLAQPVHRIGGFQRRLAIDMDEGALALACGIGDPGDALLDELAGGGRAAGEIGGKGGERRVVRHGFHFT